MKSILGLGAALALIGMGGGRFHKDDVPTLPDTDDVSYQTKRHRDAMGFGYDMVHRTVGQRPVDPKALLEKSHGTKKGKRAARRQRHA